jgi:hypothetical protein
MSDMKAPERPEAEIKGFAGRADDAQVCGTAKPTNQVGSGRPRGNLQEASRGVNYGQVMR